MYKQQLENILQCRQHPLAYQFQYLDLDLDLQSDSPSFIPRPRCTPEFFPNDMDEPENRNSQVQTNPRKYLVSIVSLSYQPSSIVYANV